MAVGSWLMFNLGMIRMAEGQGRLWGVDAHGTSAALVMRLITNGYTPNTDIGDVWTAISPFELSTGLGYTAGGKFLSGMNMAQAGGIDLAFYDANNVAWTTFSATFKYAVIVDVAGPPTDLPLFICDMDTSSSSASVTGLGGTLTIQLKSPGATIANFLAT